LSTISVLAVRHDKMAVGIQCRQRTVLEFLVKENISAADVYERLRRVYGDA